MIQQEYHEQDAPFDYLDNIDYGNSGVVDIVRCRKTAKIYARKSIRLPQRADSPSREEEYKAKIEKIVEEARIIRSLWKNPHIVEVVETYVTTSRKQTRFCIILPLAEHDLKQAIADVGKMRPGTKKNEELHKMRHWAACLVRATDYMHDRRVKHKDIKPGNILVRGEDVWITDFGIAKDFAKQDSESYATHLDGTRAYCPLETFQYKRRGKASDIFSLGCCFLEMATVIIADRKLEELRDLRKEAPSNELRPYAQAQPGVLRWIFYLFSVLAAQKLRIAQTNGVKDNTVAKALSDPGRATLLPAFALLMMDPNSAQRITARQLVVFISAFQEDMYCVNCRVGVPKVDPIHGLHSKFKWRETSPELWYPADPEDVLKPGFQVPFDDWEAAKRYWLKDHMWWSEFS
jgi:serine/threonine protein kinase